MSPNQIFSRGKPLAMVTMLTPTLQTCLAIMLPRLACACLIGQISIDCFLFRMNPKVSFYSLELLRELVCGLFLAFATCGAQGNVRLPPSNVLLI